MRRNGNVRVLPHLYAICHVLPNLLWYWCLLPLMAILRISYKLCFFPLSWELGAKIFLPHCAMCENWYVVVCVCVCSNMCSLCAMLCYVLATANQNNLTWYLVMLEMSWRQNMTCVCQHLHDCTKAHTHTETRRVRHILAQAARLIATKQIESPANANSHSSIPWEVCTASMHVCDMYACMCCNSSWVCHKAFKRFVHSSCHDCVFVARARKKHTRITAIYSNCGRNSEL